MTIVWTPRARPASSIETLGPLYANAFERGATRIPGSRDSELVTDSANPSAT